jgi:hypothetical protein
MGKNYVNCPHPDCEEIMIVEHALFDDWMQKGIEE